MRAMKGRTPYTAHEPVMPLACKDTLVLMPSSTAPLCEREACLAIAGSSSTRGVISTCLTERARTHNVRRRAAAAALQQLRSEVQAQAQHLMTKMTGSREVRREQ